MKLYNQQCIEIQYLVHMMNTWVQSKSVNHDINPNHELGIGYCQNLMLKNPKHWWVILLYFLFYHKILNLVIIFLQHIPASIVDKFIQKRQKNYFKSCRRQNLCVSAFWCKTWVRDQSLQEKWYSFVRDNKLKTKDAFNVFVWR